MSQESSKQNQNMEDAARETIQDVLKLIHGDFKLHQLQISEAEPTLSGTELADLLERNFARLDMNGDGISKDELDDALDKKAEFSVGEYAMLQLLSKYFHTIVNMCDDEDGPETRISKTDSDVLCQFLRHSQLTLADLSKWQNEYALFEEGQSR